VGDRDLRDDEEGPLKAGGVSVEGG
jgi:hypothetical protein